MHKVHRSIYGTQPYPLGKYCIKLGTTTTMYFDVSIFTCSCRGAQQQAVDVQQHCIYMHINVISKVTKTVTIQKSVFIRGFRQIPV